MGESRRGRAIPCGRKDAKRDSCMEGSAFQALDALAWAYGSAKRMVSRRASVKTRGIHRRDPCVFLLPPLFARLYESLIRRRQSFARWNCVRRGAFRRAEWRYMVKGSNEAWRNSSCKDCLISIRDSYEWISLRAGDFAPPAPLCDDDMTMISPPVPTGGYRHGIGFPAPRLGGRKKTSPRIAPRGCLHLDEIT